MWHVALKYTSRGLKVVKCYWTLHNYKQHNSTCAFITNTSHSLSIEQGTDRVNLEYLLIDITRSLVDIGINPAYTPKYTLAKMEEKVVSYI